MIKVEVVYCFSGVLVLFDVLLFIFLCLVVVIWDFIGLVVLFGGNVIIGG